jgi:pimeloyl-ACP methyl ester carboxylesterase
MGCRTEGNGERKVILLHGRNSHSGTWRRTFPELVQDYSVFAPSLPPDFAEQPAVLVERHALHVREMCDKLGISNASVVGSSIGGWVAMRLASFDGLVSRLILEDTAGANSKEAEELEHADVPTIIIWGENDDVIPIEEGRFLHSRIEGSEMQVIQGANHVPHWEEPETFNRLLVQFLRER